MNAGCPHQIASGSRVLNDAPPIAPPAVFPDDDVFEAVVPPGGAASAKSDGLAAEIRSNRSLATAIASLRENQEAPGRTASTKSDALASLRDNQLHLLLSWSAAPRRHHTQDRSFVAPRVFILALLILADALCFLLSQEPESNSMVTGGLALLAVYACLATWVTARAACGHMPWLLPSLLQLALVCFSTFWREELRLEGAVGTRAVCMAGLLQLTVVVVHDLHCVTVVLLTAASMCVLCALELWHGISTALILDDGLLFAAMSVACLLPASRHSRAKCAPQPRATETAALTELLRPIVAEPCTGLKERLLRARDASLAGHNALGGELRDLLAAVFARVASEVKAESDVVWNLNDAPPMTLAFAERTLHIHSRSESISSVGSPVRTVSNPVRTMSNMEAAIANRIGGSLRAGDLEPEDLPSAKVEKVEAVTTSVLREMLDVVGDEEAKEPCAADTAFELSLADQLRPLCYCQHKGPRPALSDFARTSLEEKLGVWCSDSFRVNELSGDRALVALGSLALAPLTQALELPTARVLTFLAGIEARYVSGIPYHNSVHGADVLNSMVYFMKLQNTGFALMEPVERLAALVAAASHDVGHPGRTNSFHVSAETPLARVYNDQSPLENMHCAVTFTLLFTANCNFLSELTAHLRVGFRACAVQMILETDLAKHCQSVNHFRRELLHAGDVELTPLHRRELLAFALKCCDVAHSTKPFDLHVLWTLRINAEFFDQGDKERELGLPCSPFCDRHTTQVAESQRGFYKFIVVPLYQAMNEHLGNLRLGVEVMSEMERNQGFWQTYDGTGFNYSDPTRNCELLRNRFRMTLQQRRGILQNAKGRSHKDRTRSTYSEQPILVPREDSGGKATPRTFQDQRRMSTPAFSSEDEDRSS